MDADGYNSLEYYKMNYFWNDWCGNKINIKHLDLSQIESILKRFQHTICDLSIYILVQELEKRKLMEESK